VSGPWLQHPEWLGAALGGVGVAALALLAARARARRRAARLLGARAPAPAARADLLPWLALAALAAALLGPRLGLRELRLAAEGADVVVLLDVSRSMTAADAPPSRLHRARRSADAVLGRLGAGDRAALAAFAGHGVLLTPLSSDAGALRELLPHLDETLIGAGGSNADDGIAVALEALSASPPGRPRAILLLSDGEDPAGRGADAAAAAAARAGVRIVSAAFGSEAGAPLVGAVLRETGGRTVVSRRDAAALARLSAASGGAAFAADAWGDVDPDALVAALQAGPRAAAPGGATRSVQVPALRTGACAALAFALLALELMVAGGRARLRRAGAGAAAAAGAAALLGSAPGDAPPATPSPAALEETLRERPGDPRALVWLGLARAGRGDADEAARAFHAAALLSGDPHLAALAWHDLGVTELARGELERARDAFFAALERDPARRSSVFNLEWTLSALARRPPAQGGGEREGPPETGEQEPRPEPGRSDPREGDDAAPAAAASGAEPGGAGAPAEPAAPPPPALDDAEARRWLEAAPDDAARALRGAAARAGASRPRVRGPGW
jgi:Ca-activated chloride channel family protein